MIKGLPEKLKQLRKYYKMSQKDVASRLGISTSIVSGYETGERTPSTEVLLAFSYLYKCSTDYLLGREDSFYSPKLNTDGLTDEQVKAISLLIDTMIK